MISQVQQPLPTKIGDYKIESLLGKGATSSVYLAVRPDLQEPAVVKVLSQKYLFEPQMIERFLREAQIIEMTNHPNIIRLFGHGKWEGGAYIATEFVQGISLRQMILQEAMSLRRSLEIILQISHGLTHLHAHGIIHRDLKPENILLTAQGGVKIIDFGIAAIEEEGMNLGAHGLGTPAYLSPEMQSDPRKASFSADVYALGVIAYELILGRLSHGKIHIHLLPKGLQSIIANALQPDPLKRYEDIVDFVKALSDYLKTGKVEKDLRGSDQGGALKEALREIQSHFVPAQVPSWRHASLGFASNNNLSISSVYYDFFDRQDGYHIVIGEAYETGVEGLFHMAFLKGIVYALAQQELSPTEFVKELNRVLLVSKERIKISFVYLTLNPLKQKCAYISCGDVPLWKISAGKRSMGSLKAKNPPLGQNESLSVIEADANWSVGDGLILVTSQGNHLSPQVIEKAMSELEPMPPPKQAEFLFRKLHKTDAFSSQEQALTIIAIERTL